MQAYVKKEDLEKELINLKKEFQELILKRDKEFQEFKAKQEEVINSINERDKLIDRFWKERIAYLSIIVALIVALITLIIK
ncbi:MAG: hypothetical protein ACE5J9_11520 [Methanosarcinales archaeon]